MTAPVRSTEHVRWGYADMWFGEADETIPASAATLAEPATGYTGVGYTAEGATLTVTKETEEARVEEELLAIGEDVVNVGLSLTLAFAEDTLENRAMAYGIGEVVTTAASSGQIGKKKLSFDTNLRVISLVLMATNGYGFKDRIYLPRVIATGDVETAYRRSPSEKRIIPVTFKVIGTLDDIDVTQMTAEATA